VDVNSTISEFAAGDTDAVVYVVEESVPLYALVSSVAPIAT
jgi:hypothetical protein